MLETLFKNHYPQCGIIQSFKAQHASNLVSNQHYFVSTDKGAYLLKQISHPEALYEHDGKQRLKTISFRNRACARIFKKIRTSISNALPVGSSRFSSCQCALSNNWRSGNH